MEIQQFKEYLINEEKAEATVEKYIRDVAAFGTWLDRRDLSKAAVQEYKKHITDGYEASSVNTMLSSLNAYFDFIGHAEYKVKSIKIQKNDFCEPTREMTKDEYTRLVQTAHEQGKIRLYLLMQTLCSCGLRVSELKFITAEAVEKGVAMVENKGKTRKVYLPQKLINMLRPYMLMKGIKHGAIFITKTGNCLDRSNVWTEMKKLCEKAGVLASKVFPHSLRSLFARTYYKVHQDIVRLADILGHSSINTTRVYTAESGEEHRRRIQKLDLVIKLPIFPMGCTT